MGNHRHVRYYRRYKPRGEMPFNGRDDPESMQVEVYVERLCICPRCGRRWWAKEGTIQRCHGKSFEVPRNE